MTGGGVSRCVAAPIPRGPPATRLKICPETKSISKALLTSEEQPAELPFCNLARKKLGEGGFAEVLLGFRRRAGKRPANSQAARTLGVQSLARFYARESGGGAKQRAPDVELKEGKIATDPVEAVVGEKNQEKTDGNLEDDAKKMGGSTPRAKRRRASCPPSLLGTNSHFHRYFEEIAIKVTQRADPNPTLLGPTPDLEHGERRGPREQPKKPAERCSKPAAISFLDSGCWGPLLRFLCATDGSSSARPAGSTTSSSSTAPEIDHRGKKQDHLGVCNALDARAQLSAQLEQRNLEILRKIRARPHANVVTFYGSFDFGLQRYLALGLLRFDLSNFFDGILQRCKADNLEAVQAGGESDCNIRKAANKKLLRRNTSGSIHNAKGSSALLSNLASEAIVRELFSQLLRGLHHLHEELKVAHLDIKLENLMVAEVPQVYLDRKGYVEDCLLLVDGANANPNAAPRQARGPANGAPTADVPNPPGGLPGSASRQHDWKILSHARSAKPPFLLKIIDFGLSLPFDDDKFVRADRVPLGTRQYRAPELQWRKMRHRPSSKIDVTKVDLYAAGVVLFKMRFLGNARGGFASSHRFREVVCNKEDVLEVHSEVANGGVEKLADFLDAQGIERTGALRRLLCEGLLAVDPEKRWSMEEVMDDAWLNAVV